MVPSFCNETINVYYYPVLTFKKSSYDDIKLRDVLPALNDSEKTERENLIVCKNCGNAVTSPKNILEINGKHSHMFTNPAGAVFHIGCFTSAKGCKISGEPTFEFTWFSGFTWCYAICFVCNAHLGWYYQSGSDSFYGLILKNLAENT